MLGSYARGEATESSDVDILVDRGDIRSGFVLGGLYADLRDGLRKELDMITTQGADAEFLARIQKDEVLIFESSASSRLTRYTAASLPATSGVSSPCKP